MGGRLTTTSNEVLTMASKNSTRARPAPSRPTPTPRLVSPAAMHQAMLAIADRYFSRAYDEMFHYVASVNPNGHSFTRQYLRTMRKVLDDRESYINRQEAARKQRNMRRAS
jgi:hypothetical protein